jgi:hypothetical protein
MRPLTVIVMHNLQALAHIIHVHITYHGNLNTVKNKCPLIVLIESILPDNT